MVGKEFGGGGKNGGEWEIFLGGIFSMQEDEISPS